MYAITKFFQLFQFNLNFNGDYISIKEIGSTGNLNLLAYLTGPDEGPKSESISSNWKKKIISSTTNKMIIEFKSDDIKTYKWWKINTLLPELKPNKGFSASIYFTPLPIKNCESWLAMNKTIFKSPNYPQTYYDSMKCSWLITVDPDYHITLDFFDIYVRYQIQNYDISLYISKFIFAKSDLKIQIEADTGILMIYDGGSEQAEMICNLNGEINDTKISTPRNQVFVVLNTHGKNASIRLNATVIKSK